MDNTLGCAKLILIVRNPIEAFLRHDPRGFESFLCRSTNVFDYFSGNLQRFKRFSGRKMVVFYKDLAIRPSFYVDQLHGFVDFYRVTGKEFMDEFEKHFSACRVVYSEGQSDGKSVLVHSRDLPVYAKILFWKCFFEKCPIEDHAMFCRYVAW